MTEEKLPSLEERIAKSSQIMSVAFDAAHSELIVVFKSSPTFMYAYLDVPTDVWANLQAAPSIGSFIFTAVKSRFSFEKRPIKQADQSLHAL